MMARALRTFEQAQAATDARQVKAVTKALSRFLSGPELSTAVAQAIAAYRFVVPVLQDDCPHVDDKWGQCEREFGHDGDHYTYEYDDPRRPDGAHPWDY